MYRFIENIGDYFSTNYFDEDFVKKVTSQSGYSAEDVNDFGKKINALKEKYFNYKNELLYISRAKDRIKKTYAFHSLLLKALGYESEHDDYDTLFNLKDNEVIPVRNKLYRGHKPHLFVMEMQPMIKIGEAEPKGLFEQVYNTKENSDEEYDWSDLLSVADGETIAPSIINQAISQIFLLDEQERPKFILMLAGSEVYLLNDEKWFKGSYLRFNLEELFDQAALSKSFYSLFYFLLSKESLSPDSDIILMEKLDEESHKSAYAVTQDLKKGIINAIEALANEAVFYITEQNLAIDKEHNDFAEHLKNDCLTIVYRLLFIFYAESREELGILPINDEVYEKGYSLEMLRDLELVPLTSEQTKNGYFFHDSLDKLFNLLNTGYKILDTDNESFKLNKLDSPIFDPKNLKILKNIKFRNFIWQDIICNLSLSQKQGRKARGRISYANLGVNQLGSVYEGLLAYRGFFAKEDYIEVHKAGKPQEGTFVVERSRLDEFKDNEVLKDEDNSGNVKIIKKGTFVYRLSGRDRKNSASYYTPEVLTQTTVKYTLKGIVEKLEKGEVSADEILEMKILEPAMGAAAFQNEVINQLSVIYLDAKQKELNNKVSPSEYQDELQQVKAYIATNNIYGVDLNSTAVELGKLSLWLNVIHKNMETPYFGYRLGHGNAVVGAWLKTYDKSDVSLEKNGNRVIKKEWWNQAPKLGGFNKDKSNKRKVNQVYHFLLPDKNMVPSAGIKLLKAEHKIEADRVSKWKTTFCRPFDDEEFNRVIKIADKIDQLLDDHYEAQTELNKLTKNSINIWGQNKKLNKKVGDDEERWQKSNQEVADARNASLFDANSLSYIYKDNLLEQRNNADAPYHKLKTIMDYWCSLWFYDLRDAVHLPSREEFYSDIEAILELSVDCKGELNTPKRNNHSISDQISETDSNTELFDNYRMKIATVAAKKYNFFHTQLEFIEVFKERGGFDVINGNPPWVKVTFEEKDLISEIHPKVLIRKTSAPDVAKMRNEYFEDEVLKESYIFENILLESTSSYLNAYQNFPLLKGQQTNLYKCIIENTFNFVNNKGYIGLVHPETIYDDPKGQPLRKEVYKRLEYHFQFLNELILFAEVGHRMLYGISIYRGKRSKPNFLSIHNLFHPSSIDTSFIHNGKDSCSGFKIKDKQANKFVWNIHPHKERIVNFTEKELKILAKTFENSNIWETTKLVSIHASSIISILEKLSLFKGRVKDFDNIVSEGWHETNDVNAGIIKRETKFPDSIMYELIYSGPHFHTGNPHWKTPREKCIEKAHYDVLDLNEISEDFLPRTNYIPVKEVNEFKKIIKGFDKDNNWIEQYKLCFSKMLNTSSERTLQPAIIPPKVSHIFGGISIILKKINELIEFSALTSSLLLDFYIKSVGASNLTDSRIQSLPLGINKKYYNALAVRTLSLNCLTKYYKDLWEENFDSEFLKESWSIEDHRLKAFNTLTKDWNWDIPLRNYFERRQALVEIDVIVAKAFDLTLDELISIYNIQFPIMQQYEDDTYYDQNGRIIFTVNKGLSGVGLDRPEWVKVKDLKEGEVKHIITKSELYKGKEITYIAPFTKCDRVEDYKIAWKALFND